MAVAKKLWLLFAFLPEAEKRRGNHTMNLMKNGKYWNGKEAEKGGR